MDLPFTIPSQQGLKYYVDVVMCIDCTGSMHGILDTVKTNALKFYPDLKAACAKKSKNITQFRVKVIAFRDFYADRENAMHETDFFYLPEDEHDFESYVSGLIADGGGDEPENGLEAIATAIKSDWTSGGDRRRHIVVVWTDASAHPLETSHTKNEYYPEDMPADFNELFDLWQDEDASDMEPTSKRLLIFAPDKYPWSEMSASFDLAIHHPAKAGQGLTDYDYETILRSIVESI